jgi:hypothetical protein
VDFCNEEWLTPLIIGILEMHQISNYIGIPWIGANWIGSQRPTCLVAYEIESLIFMELETRILSPIPSQSSTTTSHGRGGSAHSHHRLLPGRSHVVATLWERSAGAVIDLSGEGKLQRSSSLSSFPSSFAGSLWITTAASAASWNWKSLDRWHCRHGWIGRRSTLLSYWPSRALSLSPHTDCCS